MRLDKKMKLRKRVFASTLATVMILSSSIVAFAQEKSREAWPNGFYLKATYDITGSYAYGRTDGGSGAYHNQVAVFDYNKKGQCIGNSKKTTPAEAAASAKVIKIGSYRVDSYHFIVTSNGGVLGGIKNTDSLK